MDLIAREKAGRPMRTRCRSYLFVMALARFYSRDESHGRLSLEASIDTASHVNNWSSETQKYQLRLHFNHGVSMIDVYEPRGASSFVSFASFLFHERCMSYIIQSENCTSYFYFSLNYNVYNSRYSNRITIIKISITI